MNWRGYSTDPCYQRRQNASSRNFLLKNVAVTSITRKAGGGYVSGGGGSCPKKVATPTEVTKADQAFKQALAQFEMNMNKSSKTRHGISESRLYTAVGRLLPLEARHLKQFTARLRTMRNRLKWMPEGARLADQLRVARTPDAIHELIAGKKIGAHVDRAAKSGQGISKVEAGAILKDAFAGEDKLPKANRAVLLNALKPDRFARKSTAQLAMNIVSGNVSAAKAGSMLGFNLSS